MDDDASTPVEPTPEGRREASDHAGDLKRMASDAADATWGDQPTGKVRVPGVLSGDLGPKGDVSSQLRDLSRRERATYGEVPHGSVEPGGARLLLLPMLGIAALLVLLVVLAGWLLS